MLRHDKIQAAIQKEVSQIIHDELNDPRLGFVTITRVELTQDIRYAKIFFSVLGKDEDYKKTKDALDSAAGFIRRLIAQRIKLRFAPEFSFTEDRSTEHSVKIQEILDKIKESNENKHPKPKKSNRLHKKA